MNHKDHHAGLDTEAGFVQVLNPEAARTFGTAMRKAREDAGITAERAAIVTRISPAFILALESGDFKKLPGLVFARGFVRNLCKPYRMNSAEMLDLFELALRVPATMDESRQVDVAPEDEAEPEVADTGRARTPFNASRLFTVSSRLMVYGKSLQPFFAAHKRHLAFGAGGIVAILAIAVVVTQFPNDEVVRESVEVSPPVVEPSDPVVAEAPLTDVTSQEPSVTAAPAPTEPTVAEAAPVSAPKVAEVVKPYKAENALDKRDASEKHVLNVGLKSDGGTGRQQVEIIAKSQVVVRFAKDGGAFETKTLDARTHNFDFQSEAQLLIFDAAAVDVKFNGRSLGPLGNRGRVRRISFRKEDLANGKKL